MTTRANLPSSSRMASSRKSPKLRRPSAPKNNKRRTRRRRRKRSELIFVKNVLFKLKTTYAS